MRIFFLTGSLTIGAGLAFGLTHFAGSARLLVGVAIIIGALCLWYVVRNREQTKTSYVYTAGSEADRYTELDVREIFHALSEAKARSMAPFPKPGAGESTGRDRSPKWEG